MCKINLLVFNEIFFSVCFAVKEFKNNSSKGKNVHNIKVFARQDKHVSININISIKIMIKIHRTVHILSTMKRKFSF